MIYANCDMNPIQGERFQDLCETQISKIEHKEFHNTYRVSSSILIKAKDFTKHFATSVT